MLNPPWLPRIRAASNAGGDREYLPVAVVAHILAQNFAADHSIVAEAVSAAEKEVRGAAMRSCVDDKLAALAQGSP